MKQIIRITGIIGLFLVFVFPLVAQKINVPKKVENQTINRANRRTDQGISKGLDAVEGGIKDAFKKDGSKKEEPKKESAKDKGTANSEESSKDNATATSKADATPSLASYSKYDFTPGEKVIFFEDFSQDAIGDFPALWYTNGSGEVVTMNNYPGHWLMTRAKSDYCYLFEEAMPDNYTIEFDLIRTNCNTNATSTDFYFISIPKGKNAFASVTYPGLRMTVSHEQNVRISNFGVEAMEHLDNSQQAKALKANCHKVVKVSVWVQKQRMRIYFDEEKVFDIPRMLPKEPKVNAFRFFKGWGDKTDFISNIRVAVGAPDMRNKLLTEGKLVTYGIMFDTGSDKVKPESYGTIKSIADVLKENADVKVKIVGHTDADGDAAKNIDLSKRRAASVKSELVNSFGIDASRLETDGKGKTEPIGPNDTPVNKAKNRRVEFIKL